MFPPDTPSDEPDFEPIESADATGLPPEDPPADWTEIPAVLPAQSDRRRRGDRVRFGPILVPAVVVSWGASVLVHGGVILGGYLAARLYFRHAELPDRWGGGGGGGAGAIVASADSTNVVRRGLPAVPSHLPEPAPDHPVWSDAHRPAEPAWGARQTASSLARENEPADEPVIGVVGSATGGPLPARPHAGGAPAAPGLPTGSAAGGSAPASGNTGQTTGPGLPGALLGKGLPTPDYPLESRRRGEQGLVRIAIEIKADGSIGRVRVLSGPGYPRLRDAALAAANKLRAYPFAPARRLGRAVDDEIIVPYNFTLK